jgi:hypothetical protein
LSCLVDQYQRIIEDGHLGAAGAGGWMISERCDEKEREEKRE